jgi:hypothetical protein
LYTNFRPLPENCNHRKLRAPQDPGWPILAGRGCRPCPVPSGRQTQRAGRRTGGNDKT